MTEKVDDLNSTMFYAQSENQNKKQKVSEADLKNSVLRLEQKIADLRAKKQSQEKINPIEAELQVAFARFKARSAWERYFRPNAAPTSVPADARKCANTAFIAAQVSQVFDLYVLSDRAFKGEKLTEEIDRGMGNEPSPLPKMGKLSDTETAILMGAVYNKGRRLIAKTCGAPQVLQTCINQLKAKNHPIPGEYMESLRTCAAKNNWQPMRGQKENCEDEGCSI